MQDTNEMISPSFFDVSELEWDDRVILTLKRLYRNKGYERYRINRFEPYGVYFEHLGFLRDSNVITFTGADGKLMALKPDVTLSIVKNAKQQEKANQKLFYVENVFRIHSVNNEFSEISQVGVERIGLEEGETCVSVEADIIELALQSLRVIGSNVRMVISHMGFDAAVIDQFAKQSTCALPLDDATKILRRICVDLNQGVEQNTDEDGARKEKVEAGTDNMSEENNSGISAQVKAKQSCSLALVDQLEKLYELLCEKDCEQDVFFDFSQDVDAHYYTGITFQGYVENLPRFVLSGGRYDGLMERFGSDSGAIGFAIYLGEISRDFIHGKTAQGNSGKSSKEGAL